MNSKIALSSRILSLVSSAFILIIPTTVAGMWLFASEQTLLSELPSYWFVPPGILFQEGTLDHSVRVICAAISLLANLPLILALWHLRKLFDLYKALEVFRAEAATRMKMFATFIVAFALLQPIAGAALSLASSINNPPGARFLSISIADTDLATVFLGLTMIVIANVLEEAHKVFEDNKSFV